MLLLKSFVLSCRRLGIFLFIIGLSWQAPRAWATDVEDLYGLIIPLHGIELGAGGRAIALGGAYRALSDDLSGLYWNPAGLASVRRIEFGLGLSEGITFDRTQIGAFLVDNDLSRTRLNELGIVFPVPTFQGSLVFALGYHQVHNYDAYGIFKSNDGIWDFQADEMETGRLGVYSFGGAIDVSPTASFGLGLRLWKGLDDFSYNSLQVADPQNYVDISENINSEISGFNMMGGMLLRPFPWLRLGATLETPLKYKITETGSYSEQISYQGQLDPPINESSSFIYHLSRPWRFGTGVAVMVHRFVISADAGLTDWSQVTFTDDTPVTYLSKVEANNLITRKLRTVLDGHLGVEYWLPFANARVQAGYAYMPTPFTTTEVLTSKNVFSGGFSFLVDPSFQVQGSVAYSLWERSLGGWNEDLRLAQFMLTLSYRI